MPAPVLVVVVAVAESAEEPVEVRPVQPIQATLAITDKTIPTDAPIFIVFRRACHRLRGDDKTAT
jgi:hypothetical protein